MTWQRNQFAEKIRKAVQNTLTANFIDHWSLVVSLVAREAGPLQWRVIVMTSRGKISLQLAASSFESDAHLQREVADAVARSLPDSQTPEEREHALVYCWCGHSGMSPSTERGAHYFGTIQKRDRNSHLYCRDCEADPSGLKEKLLRPRPTPCEFCHGGYLWSATAGEPGQLCDRCEGMGFLRPQWYEVHTTQPVVM